MNDEKDKSEENEISLLKVTIQKFVRLLNENFGKLILINLLWFVFAIPVFALLFLKSRINLTHFFILFFLFLVLLNPATVSVFEITFQMIEGKDMNILKDFFAGIREHLKKGIVSSFVPIIIFTSGFSGLWFYFKVKALSILAIILISICFLIFLFFSLMQNYLFPLMIQKKLNIKESLQKSIYLIFDNFGFSLVIFLLGFLMWTVLAFSGLGTLVLFISMPGLLYNLAMKSLFVGKYGMEDKIFKRR